MDFLKNNKDLLIEKPITTTIDEARELIEESEKRNLILQVGHLERFNSGFLSDGNAVRSACRRQHYLRHKSGRTDRTH